jgi:hypothetical protein
MVEVGVVVPADVSLPSVAPLVLVGAGPVVVLAVEVVVVVVVAPPVPPEVPSSLS